MTGIEASQKEKNVSRLLYRICGSGLTSFQLQNIKKLEEGPFVDIKKFFKKSLTMPKKLKRAL